MFNNLFLFAFFAAPHGLWDVSLPTRNQTETMAKKVQGPITRPPGNSRLFSNLIVSMSYSYAVLGYLKWKTKIQSLVYITFQHRALNLGRMESVIVLFLELNLRDKLIRLDDFWGPFQLEFKDVIVRRNL